MYRLKKQKKHQLSELNTFNYNGSKKNECKQ